MSVATVDPNSVADSVALIRQRIAELAGGRTVHLIAVTTGFGADAISAASAAGCTMIGENFAHELVTKIAEMTDSPTTSAIVLPEVHFIGQLQTNKVRKLAGVVEVWQSVDRASLVDELVSRVPGARVFVQVNATREADKGGCSPEQVAGLVERCRASELRVQGLMAVGPTSPDAERTSTAFALTRRLADDNGLADCSMGMTDDMEIPIEQGATHVRIGRALFGGRPHPRARIR